MKHILLLAVLLAAHRADAGTWTNDDDYVSGPNAVATATITDGTFMYVVGYDQSPERAIVRRRSLATPGWSPPNVFIGDGSARATAIAYDAQMDLLYLVGTTGPATPNPQTSRWWVRRSNDHGQSWNTIHIGTYFANGKNVPSAVRVLPNHDVVVALTATDTNNVGSWILKFSGNNWGTPIDVVTPPGPNSVATPHDMAFDTNGSLFVTGYVLGANGLHWITRIQASGSFATIDDTAGRYGNGIMQSNGVLYATGSNLAATHWFTRRSTDHGMTWSDVDDYQAASITSGSSLRAFNGDVYACGTDGNAWGVRESNDGASWGYFDRYYLNAQHQDGVANDLYVAGGHLWVVGSIYDGTVSHWYVRYFTP
jgi:hypothetical protein